MGNYTNRGYKTLCDENKIANSGRGLVARDKDLVLKRNEMMINRFVYYYKYKGMRYEDILFTMSEEVYLRPITITKILTDNSDKILRLKKETPTLTTLKKAFPHFSWDGKKG